LTLWLLSVLVEMFVVCLFASRKLVRRFLFLTFYLSLSCISSISEYVVAIRFGVDSGEYMYLYFSADTILTVFLFLSIGELGVRLATNEIAGSRVQFVVATALLASCCYAFLRLLTQPPTGSESFAFLNEFSEVVYFLCFLATFVLWIWQIHKNPRDQIAVQIVRVLLVNTSLYFLLYLVLQFVPPAPDLSRLPMIMGAAWVPLGCGFAAVSE
jgi:hypothetical protein